MQPPDTFSLRDLFSSERLPSFLSALALLGAAYLAEYFATFYVFVYSLRSTSNHVGDLILNNIPALDTNFVIVEVSFMAAILSTLFVFSKPRHVLFTLKALALFVIIRAIFISLTHIGIHPDNIALGSGFFDAVYLYLNLQTGLFFSGHTGLPFLAALIFWDIPYARYIFMSLSFIFGVAVLLAHAHYSIDVLAAPFMAYGIFKIAQHFFPRDYKLIESGYFPRP